MNKRVGYLVAEFPVVSETFVYREIRSLKERGYDVKLYTLRLHRVTDGVDLESLPSAKAVYDMSVVTHLYACFLALASNHRAFFQALKFLMEDAAELVGWRNKGKLLGQFLGAASLACGMKKDKISHLHIHFIHSPAQVGMYASAIASIPFTVTAHANDIYSQGKLLNQKAARSKCILTISEFNRRYLESLGIPPYKVRVMRCILDLPNASATVQKNNTVFRIGSLGRLVPKKGFGTLIQAFAQLVKAYPAKVIQLEIAGGGPQQSLLEELIRDSDLIESVKLLGPLHQNHVVDWMSTLDCFALACEEDKASGDVDGIPVVLMEAMSCGVPVVSTAVSGIPELIKDGITGLLAEPGNTESVCKALSKLVDVSELSSQLVVNGKQHLDTEFAKNINMNRLTSAFEV